MSDFGDDANLWQRTAGEPVVAAPLAADGTADVVVVGGGFTGVSAALHLAEAGADVCLLEALAIGHGGSGRNVGLLNAGLWLEPERVESLLGEASGRRLNDALAAGPALVFALIDQHGIDGQETRTGTLHCAHSRCGLKTLQERHRQLTQRGAPVALLSAAQTSDMTGSGRFHGALLDHRAGTVQPLSYLRGLAAAALKAGARLHERSAVGSVSFEAPYWRVETPRGTVRAEALVLATNAYHQALRVEAAPSYTPVDYFQLATEPLAEPLRASILPARQGAWDTATVMTSFRLDAAGRLILGAMGSLDGPGRPAHRAWARRRLQDLFPAVAEYPFRHAWTGRIAMTGDHLPKIVSMGDRALSIYGYSGRGIAPGTVFGKAAAEYLLSGDRDRLPMPPVRSHEQSLCGVKQAFFEAGATAFHLLADRW